MIGFKSLFVGLLVAQAVVGELDLSDNIFIQHMISARAAPFRAPTYLPPVENLVCHGQDVCVQASQCVSGYFSVDIGVAKRTCDINTEVCCTYKPKPTPVPTIPCASAGFDCVSPNQCVNGEISIKGYSQKVADQCFAPEVCCRIPVESTVLEKDGYHVRVPDTPFVIEKSTVRPFVPQPTQPAVIRVPPTQPPVYLPPVTPAPTVYVPKTQPPVYIQPTPAPTVYVPKTQPPVYLPPATPAPVRPVQTPAPIRPQPIRPQPVPTQPPVYLPPVTAAPVRPTQAPVRIPQPTRPRPVIVSTQAPIYLPPTPPRRGEDIKSEPIYKPKPTQNYLPPNRGENILSEPIYKPTPQTCAAALKCTPIDFCTKEGVISKTPVSLSPNEELFRVPLTDCDDEVSGLQGGKCCRDPDYVDPWPTNLLISGQYDPTLFQQN